MPIDGDRPKKDVLNPTESLIANLAGIVRSGPHGQYVDAADLWEVPCVQANGAAYGVRTHNRSTLPATMLLPKALPIDGTPLEAIAQSGAQVLMEISGAGLAFDYKIRIER